MRIEHIAIYVSDIDKTVEFYVRFFHAHATAAYRNANTLFQSRFLTFESGARVEVMNRPNLGAKGNSLCLGYNHFAISVGSQNKVDELYHVFQANGVEIVSPPRFTGDGYYECCISDPDGNLIEITI